MNKNMRGFSLLEAMIALVILTIGILGASKMELTMSASEHLSRQREMAVLIASSKLEELRDSGTCGDKGSVTETTTTPTQSSATFEMTVTCTTTTDATVTVTWQDASGDENNVKLDASVSMND